VAEDGSIAAIIDWESAVFYPLFWLGTKPLISAGFSLHGAETRAWATLLAACIEQEGFPSDVHTYQAWKREIRK
jgi:hypothetical protein